MNKSEVVILAGGFGTRLSEVLGPHTPKPMALFNSVPLLEHQILLCKKYGFKNILILVHHLSEVIENYFGNGSKFGVKIDFYKEQNPRGTAGAVSDCVDLLCDDFLVIYGDTFLDVDLKAFYDEHTNKGSDILAFTHPNSHPYDSDLFKVDENNRIIKIFRPKPEENYSNLVNAALYVAKKDMFSEHVKTNGVIDIAKNLFPILIDKKKKLMSYKSVEYIKDMGTPERYLAVSKDLENGCVENLSVRNKRKAIFLDRDGVINKEVGHLSNIDDFSLLDDVAEAIKIINKSGYLAICVTNQPVIARGELTFSGLDKIHCHMEAKLGEKGAYLDDIFFCPHHPDKGFDGEVKELKYKCECRKPKPGMLFEAAKKYNIDLNLSWTIGDHLRDIMAGENAGTKTIYISNLKHDLSMKIDHKFDNLLGAIKYIFNQD